MSVSRTECIVNESSQYNIIHVIVRFPSLIFCVKRSIRSENMALLLLTFSKVELGKKILPSKASFDQNDLEKLFFVSLQQHQEIVLPDYDQ